MLSLFSRSLIACTATILLVSTGLSQQSVSARSVSYELNIPAENLDAALQALALGTHHKLLYRAELVAGKASPALIGTYTTEEAVTRLLEGSKLSFEITPASVVLIKGQEVKDTPLSPSAQVASDDKKETGRQSSQDFRLAQVDQGPAKSDDTVNQTNKKSDKSDQGPQQTAGLAEILVVGARTMNIDVTRTENDVQPYTIYSAEQIERSSATTVEDFLRQQLTMNASVFLGTQLGPISDTTGNVSFINLRGLGSNETLVLIDGRRSAGAAFPGVIGQPDINGIPMAAIERIEVLPSSASAIYGGAAVGGVVNIILKRDFNGGDLRYTFDKPTSSGAHQQTISASFGTSFFGGRTQVMIGGSYADGVPLLVQDRPGLFERGISTVLANSPSTLYNSAQPFEGATPNIASADGTYNSNFTVFTPTPLTLRDGTPLNCAITSVPKGSAPGGDLSAGLLANACKYNLNLAPGNGLFGLQSPLGTVPLVKSVFATLRQTLFDDVVLFTSFSTSSNSTRMIENAFGGSFSVPSSAPTNPFQQDVTISFPSTIGSVATSDSVAQSATVGLIVPLSRGWSSELDYTWSQNSFSSASPSYDYTALSSGLAAGTINPFVDTLAHPLNLNSYIAVLNYAGATTLNDVNLRASGPVGSLPAGRPTLTVGLEHRREGSRDSNQSLDYPINPENNFEAVYFGQSQSTNSVYAEGLVPLVAPGIGIPGIHALDLQVAGRSERYTVDAGTPLAYLSPAYLVAVSPPQGAHTAIEYTSTNPTIGLKYQPIADWTARVSYSRAFLPPTPAQFLLNPSLVCGATPCLPITDPKNGETYLVNATAGGNPNLKPQTSNDLDLGLIWQPAGGALQGLRINLEYYRITQPNYITQPSYQQVLSDPAFANRVTRDSTTGLVTSVDTSYLNATEYKTSGWDLKFDERKSTPIGTLGFHAAATFINYDQRQFSIGAPFLEFAGNPHVGGEAKLKANATFSWEYRQWSAAWTTTYYSSYWQVGAPGSPFAATYGTQYTDPQGGLSISSQIYHDLFVSYVFDKAVTGNKIADSALANTGIQFGIKNVLNTRPPFDAFSNPYYYSLYGDPRLRDFRLTLKKSF